MTPDERMVVPRIDVHAYRILAEIRDATRTRCVPWPLLAPMEWESLEKQGLLRVAYNGSHHVEVSAAGLAAILAHENKQQEQRRE